MYFLGAIIESWSLNGHNLDNDMQYHGSFYIFITKIVYLFSISDMFYIQTLSTLNKWKCIYIFKNTFEFHSSFIP